MPAPQKPEKRVTTQADIDAALQEWNGDIKNKHAVVEYMREHARDKDTAAFLRSEYGDDLPAFPVTVGHTSTDLPWPKVQRRIAQLIRENRFYTQEEQATSDLSGQPITRTGDTIENGITFHNVVLSLSGEQREDVQQAIPENATIPLPYKVGDTVYLDNKPFEITNIGTSDVQLRDPALAYPIFRAESRENFENMLRRDSRNGPITEFLAADLEHTDADLRETLTSGLLEQRDKEHIAGYFRENEGNTRVAQRLSDTYSGTSDTMELTTGETADLFATTTGFEINIHDKYNSKRSARWEEIAPILRALYQREQDGFSHEPVLRGPANLDGKPFYQPGDHAVLDYGGQELSGTVGYVGEKDVRIDTGPYSWSHEVVSRDAFENGIRQDERNADLFTPEQPPPKTSASPTSIWARAAQRPSMGTISPPFGL